MVLIWSCSEELLRSEELSAAEGPKASKPGGGENAMAHLRYKPGRLSNILIVQL
jgi:hypothetical protein